MKRSIGGKIYAVLAVLSIVFAVMLFINYSTQSKIDRNNQTVNVYMQMQEVKSEVSTAFQQVQLYSNLTYFKKDKEDEKDLMIEKLGNSMRVMDDQLNELGQIIAKTDDQEIGEVYNAWRKETDSFKSFIDEIHSYAMKGDYDAVFERVNVQKEHKDPVQTAEDNYDELVKEKEARIIRITDQTITMATMTNVIAVILFVSVVIGAVLIVRITIAKPARVTGKALDGIVKKLQNNEGDLTERIPVKTKDEVGQMTAGINGFMEQLQSLMRTLKAQSQKMMDSVELVCQGLDESAMDANSVSATMQQMSASMEEISATLETIVVGNDGMAQEVAHVGIQVTDGVDLVGEIQGRAEQMHKTTVQGKETTGQILEEIRAVLQEAVNESKSVTKIQELTGEILSISSQTNLLSLNASIEAARAGEAGRGFAVVADEIRDLADDSRDTASNIQEISALVINAVDKLASSAEKMIDFIDNKVMNDYDDFVAVVNQYKNDAESVHEILNGISENTESITETMQAMNTGINDISVAVDENTRGVTSVAASVVNLVDELERIHDATTENERISVELSEEVRRFKNV